VIYQRVAAPGAEGRNGVRVINVAPGYIRTNLHKTMGISFEEYSRELGDPDFLSAEEVAEVILFCSNFHSGPASAIWSRPLDRRFDSLAQILCSARDAGFARCASFSFVAPFACLDCFSHSSRDQFRHWQPDRLLLPGIEPVYISFSIRAVVARIDDSSHQDCDDRHESLSS
jgi:hypothetical protein